MSQITVRGVSGGAIPIKFDPDEMTTIYNHLLDITDELKSNVEPNIIQLGELNFYEAGNAIKAISVYGEANEKIMDLYDNYFRASTLVTDILNQMIETDHVLAAQINEKIGGVIGWT